MAKDRADKPRKEKADKAEKKVSKDKVKKEKKDKKDKKPKRVLTPEFSEDDATGEHRSESSEHDTPDPEAEVHKKQKKSKKSKEDKKSKKSKKAALEALVAEGAGASNGVTLPIRPTSKGSDVSNVDDADGGAPLFTIDVNPTPINPAAIATRDEAMDRASSSDKDTDDDDPSQIPPPSGMNRQARRRIRMIETQREKIRKELGVPVGSSDKADEVQEQLDKWVVDFDGKAAIRMEKKRKRKEREANRIKSKRGKLLTGRRLKERKKQLDKVEKKASKKQGLSAVNA